MSNNLQDTLRRKKHKKHRQPTPSLQPNIHHTRPDRNNCNHTHQHSNNNHRPTSQGRRSRIHHVRAGQGQGRRMHKYLRLSSSSTIRSKKHRHLTSQLNTLIPSTFNRYRYIRRQLTNRVRCLSSLYRSIRNANSVTIPNYKHSATIRRHFGRLITTLFRNMAQPTCPRRV